MRTPLLACLLLVGCAGRIEPEQTSDASASEASTETATTTSPTTTTTPIVDTGVAVPEVEPPPKGCDPTAAKGALVDALGTACLDEAQWKDAAATACKAKGGVASLRVGPACGWFRYRNFRCCAADGTCTERRDGSESSCKPFGVWRGYSDDDCTRDGRTLTAMTLDTPCGPTVAGYQSARYQCCL